MGGLRHHREALWGGLKLNVFRYKIRYSGRRNGHVDNTYDRWAWSVLPDANKSEYSWCNYCGRDREDCGHEKVFFAGHIDEEDNVYAEREARWCAEGAARDWLEKTNEGQLEETKK